MMSPTHRTKPCKTDASPETCSHYVLFSHEDYTNRGACDQKLLVVVLLVAYFTCYLLVIKYTLVGVGKG